MIAAALSYGYNVTRQYSPIVLNTDWPTLTRLVIIICFSGFGTLLNGFFIASFFTERPLKRVGNVFLASVGVADFIVTACVMPVAGIVMLAGQWDDTPLCLVLQFITEASNYAYSLFFVLVAIENYFRICHPNKTYRCCMSKCVATIAVVVFLLSFALGAIGVFNGLDYDYCERKHQGNTMYRLMTTLGFFALPTTVTALVLSYTSMSIRNRARTDAMYRRGEGYRRDQSITKLHIMVYSMFICAWVPYIIIVQKKSAPDYKFYHCVWAGVCRSLMTSFLYSAVNKYFRNSFNNLWSYCCFHSALSNNYDSRHSRVTYNKNIGTRVHILQQPFHSNIIPRTEAVHVQDMQQV